MGIVGCGSPGRGVEAALTRNPDMTLTGVLTRRVPAAVRTTTGAPIPGPDTIDRHLGEIDVAILCGGSKSDLPEQGLNLAALFDTVDSFDMHARIAEYVAAVDAAARGAGTTALISAGWHPGLFSRMRVLGEAVLPGGVCPAAEALTLVDRPEACEDARGRAPSHARRPASPAAPAVARPRSRSGSRPRCPGSPPLHRPPW